MKGLGMMKSARYRTCLSISVVIATTILPSTLLAQITFERTYGGASRDVGYSVYQTSDGGYIIAGQTASFGAGLDDVYLIRTDSLGDTVWTRTYGGSDDDHGECVQQTQDGGYVIGGTTCSFGVGNCVVYLIKTDSIGDTVWTRTHGGPLSDRGRSVQQTQDGGYIIAGSTWNFGAESGDVYLIKTDSLGHTVWERTYGGSRLDYGECVQQTQDGGYIISGYTEFFGASWHDVYLVKTDSLGDTVWTRAYGGSDEDYGECVRQTQDRGYIIAGEYCFGPGDCHGYVIKADSLGHVLWENTYVTWGSWSSVLQTQDGGYIIAGCGWSGAGYDVYLVRIDSFGNALWTRTYGGSNWDRGRSVEQTSDGGYIIAGVTASFGAGSYDVYLIKTDEDGLTGTEEQNAKVKIENAKLYQNTPNPFQKSTVISYSLPTATEVSLEVYDITGRLVDTLVNERQQPGIHQVRWHRKANPSGVYFYRLKAGEFVYTKKMVVVD